MKKPYLLFSFLVMFALLGNAAQKNDMKGLSLVVTHRDSRPYGKWESLADPGQSEERFLKAEAVGIKFIKEKTNIIPELNVQIKQSSKSTDETYAVYTLLAGEPKHIGKFNGKYIIPTNKTLAKDAKDKTTKIPEHPWDAHAMDYDCRYQKLILKEKEPEGGIQHNHIEEILNHRFSVPCNQETFFQK